MSLLRLAAFSDGETGGNPAGVFLSDTLPSSQSMQQIAAEVGYSETAFAKPESNGWRVRYFSPESEVPFCGHATIALGAALAREYGPEVYNLKLNEAEITVEGFEESGLYAAALQSPNTFSQPADDTLVNAVVNLFGYDSSDLNNQIPPSLANAGANHFILGLNSREALAAMSYDLDSGRQLMNNADLVTIALVYAESPTLFHTRNPFASGGVYEDPATGAATAALAGYLRDLNWPHEGAIDIIQGEDMGARSLIKAEFNQVRGTSIRVSGKARFI